MSFLNKLRSGSYSKEKLQEINDVIMKDLHPMAVGIMVSETSKIGEPKNDFERYVVDSTKAILEKRVSSRKWVESINKFVLKRILEMSAEDPEHKDEESLVLRKLKVYSVGSKISSNGPYKYCIAKNETGWKYYMTSKNLSNVDVGDTISLKGKVKSNGEDITFLTRIKLIDVDKVLKI